MTREIHRARWEELGAISERVRNSIQSPSIEFFDEEWSEFAPWYVALLSKLRALVKAEDIRFLTAEARDDGAPTGQLLLLTQTQVIEARPTVESEKPRVAVWSRTDLYQLSILDISLFALPQQPSPGYPDHPRKIDIELRYADHETINLPYAGHSLECTKQLNAALPSLQDDVSAIPTRRQG